MAAVGHLGFASIGAVLRPTTSDPTNSIETPRSKITCPRSVPAESTMAETIASGRPSTLPMYERGAGITASVSSPSLSCTAIENSDPRRFIL